MNARIDRFRAFIAHRTGVVLDADRGYMIDTRLIPVLRARKIASLEELLDRAMAETDPALTQTVIEAMLTGETFFFRDRQVFKTFQEEILPAAIATRQEIRRLRIWCAACSTGQEPYSIAMILDEEARALRGWQIEIIATDVSGSAIAAAKAAQYNQFEVQRGLPVSQLLRYFGRDQERWQLAEHLRSRVEFQQLNLKDDFAALGQFDFIFCRNILMYFDARTKADVLSRLTAALEPDGWLFLGATENTSGLAPALEPDMRAPATYRPRQHQKFGASVVRLQTARS